MHTPNQSLSPSLSHTHARTYTHAHTPHLATQIPNYWEPAKRLLNDPSKFLDSLLTYDKDNISDGVIKRVEPYILVRRGGQQPWHGGRGCGTGLHLSSFQSPSQAPSVRQA